MAVSTPYCAGKALASVDLTFSTFWRINAVIVQ